jgi:GcrA cell cycle regulator
MMLIGTSPIRKSEWFKWTEEHVAQFKDLYAQGLSHSQLGAYFGVSRNASIGKATRLGLPHRVPGRTPKPWADAGMSERTWHRHQAQASHGVFEGQGGASKNKPTYRRNVNALAHSFAAVSIGREATDLEPETIANPVTLMELQDRHCRWPHDRDGEPMMYCGAGNVIGLPYCARHCRIAYRLPERRPAA